MKVRCALTLFLVAGVAQAEARSKKYPSGCLRPVCLYQTPSGMTKYCVTTLSVGEPCQCTGGRRHGEVGLQQYCPPR